MIDAGGKANIRQTKKKFHRNTLSVRPGALIARFHFFKYFKNIPHIEINYSFLHFTEQIILMLFPKKLIIRYGINKVI